jgi:hypothetical protein
VDWQDNKSYFVFSKKENKLEFSCLTKVSVEVVEAFSEEEVEAEVLKIL